MLPPPLSLPPGRCTLVLPGFVSSRGAGTGRTIGGQAQTVSLNPLDHPAWTPGAADLMAVTVAPRSIFPLNSLLKVEAWGREKKTQCRKRRHRLTCQRRRRKTPGQGELSSPCTDRSPGFARRGGSCASARCPPSAGPAPPRPPPPPAPLSPPHRQGSGNPPARFFVQFQQSSEEVGPFVPLFIDCVNIAKRRRRSGGPSPPPAGSRERKAPAHDLSIQRASRPPAPAS